MPVTTGLENLLSCQADLLAGQKVGLVTNPTGVTADLSPNLDALVSAGVHVCALFGPEHGLRAGTADGVGVDSAQDARTGLPVHSLYGAAMRPTQEMAAGIDTFVYDIQDVGARFYTYIWTLSHVMEAAAEFGKSVVVLDRPNPLGGVEIEGGLLDERFGSLVGRWALPWRYGLTIGELAAWFNRRARCRLSVVPVAGWQRSMWYDQTGLPWVPPSPAMPSLDTAAVYPGTCLFEGTNLSEGRGTSKPFEWLGAPWMDGERWAERLNSLGLPGARFRPVVFTPSAGKHAGDECWGVQVHVIDRDRFRPVRTGLHLLQTARQLAPKHFAWLSHQWEGRPARLEHVDLLAGAADVREAVTSGGDLSAMERAWQPGLSAFDRERRTHFLYD